MKNGEIKIDKGVPIPTSRGKSCDPNSLSGKMRALKVAESIFMKDCSSEKLGNLASVVMGAGKYTVRAEGDGARIWRIK